MAGKKKNFRFGGRPNPQPKSSPYTSNMAEIKDNTFHVGASSDPAKFTKFLKNIETYIQRPYKMPDNIVKAIQKMKKPTFNPPEKPGESTCMDSAGNYDGDEHDMAKFTWKQNWKLVKAKQQKYQENEANAWVVVYNHCSNEINK
jgi:hypothetical protein